MSHKEPSTPELVTHSVCAEVMVSLEIYSRVCGEPLKLLWDSLVDLIMSTLKVCNLIGKCRNCILYITCLELLDTERLALTALFAGSVGSAMTLARRALELGTLGILCELLWQGTDMRPLSNYVAKVRELGVGSDEACSYLRKEVSDERLRVRPEVGIKYVLQNLHTALNIPPNHVEELGNSFRELTRGIYSFLSKFTHSRSLAYFSAWLKPTMVEDNPNLCNAYIIAGTAILITQILLNLIYLLYIATCLKDKVRHDEICYIASNVLKVRDKLLKLRELSKVHERDVEVALTLLDGYTLICRN